MRDFLYSLVLLGSIQGLTVASLLLYTKPPKQAHRFLAFILVLLSLPGIHLFLHFQRVYETNYFLNVVHDILPMVVIMPLGPLLYFYLQSLVRPGMPSLRRQWLHFLPVVIDLVPKLAALAMYLGMMLGIYKGSRLDLERFDSWYNQYADLPRWLSLGFYLLLSARFLRQQRRGAYAGQERQFGWPQRLILLFTVFEVCWLLYLIPYLLPGYSSLLLDAVDWFPIYIPLSVLVYWVGIQGYLMSEKPMRKPAPDSDWLRDAWQRVMDAMEKDRLYLDPALKLEQLARHVGLPARQLSELLNQYQQTNFNGLVNQYRLEAFKHQLTSAGVMQYTITGLARNCGFSSAASFQRIFRQSTGMSPSAYLRTKGQRDMENGLRTG